MILYKGIIYDDIQQKTLLKTLENDCFDTLSKPINIKTSEVIIACDKLTKKVNDGQFDNIIKPLLEEYNIPDNYFKKYVSMFSKESLEKKVSIELGNDYQSLLPLDQKNKRFIQPLGILFHIAAGNVDVLPAYSVIEGLLVGNINILKLPTGDKGVSIELLLELINIEPKLKEYIYVFDVPSTEIDTLKVFAKMADAIVVWGGDQAVKAARDMAPINTKIIDWGHKLSFAYASIDASDEDLTELAHHICYTNQLLCSSAQGIFVDTNNRKKLDLFANRFFKILLELNKTHTPVPFGMKSKNAVELYYEELVKENTKKKIWKHNGISVVTSNDNLLELSLLFRNVWIKCLPNNDIIKVIKPHKNHLQSVTILAPENKYNMYLKKIIKSGVVRIKKPIELSDVLLGESHDGMYPLRLYSRIVEFYDKYNK
ncbi:MAG: acyl-CoA reductase [Candidatus Izimaplasma sp.]|nr:acyl-CoA reductase [Candidatus Izimaplasma bacterium]